MHVLQERVLFNDTDSVIFSTLPRESNPPSVTFSESLKPASDTYIMEFAPGDPTNYGCLLGNNIEDCI